MPIHKSFRVYFLSLSAAGMRRRVLVLLIQSPLRFLHRLHCKWWNKWADLDIVKHDDCIIKNVPLKFIPASAPIHETWNQFFPLRKANKRMCNSLRTKFYWKIEMASDSEWLMYTLLRSIVNFWIIRFTPMRQKKLNSEKGEIEMKIHHITGIFDSSFSFFFRLSRRWRRKVMWFHFWVPFEWKTASKGVRMRVISETEEREKDACQTQGNPVLLLSRFVHDSTFWVCFVNRILPGSNTCDIEMKWCHIKLSRAKRRAERKRVCICPSLTRHSLLLRLFPALPCFPLPSLHLSV